MFKNVGKVLAFTFKNMANTLSYKIITILIAIVLLVSPGIACVIMASSSNDSSGSDEVIESCKLDTIYVVNEINESSIDFNILNQLGEENYENITYYNEENLNIALTCATNDADNGVNAAVLKLSLNDTESVVESYIILPDSLKDLTDTAANFNDFIDKYSAPITTMALGLSGDQIVELSMSTSTESYSESGMLAGTTKSDSLANMDKDTLDDYIRSNIISALKFILPFLNLMLFYFIVLFYCQSVSQSMVMEKQNKLMDTMLVSLKPESLAAGKTLGTDIAALLQVAIWIVSAVIGVNGAIYIIDKFYPNNNLTFIYFLKHLGDYNLFNPGKTILGIVVFIVGFFMYTSLATIAGSCASTREEAANSGYIFILPLVAAFFAVLYGGVLGSSDFSAWEALVPFVAPLVVPALSAIGCVSMVYLVASAIICVVVTAIFVYFAGKIYKFTSLFKGNKITASKVLMAVFSREV
mgnify:CR=1 FL=1